jgi:hypothetical protein
MPICRAFLGVAVSGTAIRDEAFQGQFRLQVNGGVIEWSLRYWTKLTEEAFPTPPFR